MEALFAAPIGALLIFLLRIIDVSMATLRMILVVRGRRGMAALLGFFEVLIWVVAVGQALKQLDSPLHLVGYAGGFAAGNYVGIWLAERVVPRLRTVQAFFSAAANGGVGAGKDAAQRLRSAGFAVTEMLGRGRESDVEILNVIVSSHDVRRVAELLREVDPEVFISVEDTHAAAGGHIPSGGRKMPFFSRR